MCTFPLCDRNTVRHHDVLKWLPCALLSNDSSEKGHFLFHSFGGESPFAVDTVLPMPVVIPMPLFHGAL